MNSLQILILLQYLPQNYQKNGNLSYLILALPNNLYLYLIFSCDFQLIHLLFHSYFSIVESNQPAFFYLTSVLYRCLFVSTIFYFSLHLISLKHSTFLFCISIILPIFSLAFKTYASLTTLDFDNFDGFCLSKAMKLLMELIDFPPEDERLKTETIKSSPSSTPFAPRNRYCLNFFRRKLLISYLYSLTSSFSIFLIFLESAKPFAFVVKKFGRYQLAQFVVIRDCSYKIWPFLRDYNLFEVFQTLIESRLPFVGYLLDLL